VTLLMIGSVLVVNRMVFKISFYSLINFQILGQGDFVNSQNYGQYGNNQNRNNNNNNGNNFNGNQNFNGNSRNNNNSNNRNIQDTDNGCCSKPKLFGRSSSLYIYCVNNNYGLPSGSVNNNNRQRSNTYFGNRNNQNARAEVTLN
jgi:hypothetical protein